ncbi:hypothetical protein M427DRAFT_59660 [Gonapodya prolifera JEL478]|uniref:Uncharacterized protein n=1 Tax=Gonapodya prolifera (strain JEL478) TaxID=1344416 RepID=A0A139A6H9_GONPJ|nr:hypothetical protein M427DRAFT_59660 [Gonapodya prolifera JEL478]|eukprot:KXS12334.1 hypothetical protein M427DRAFT_59660 [Gonapodya prolifera JEL478]
MARRSDSQATLFCSVDVTDRGSISSAAGTDDKDFGTWVASPARYEGSDVVDGSDGVDIKRAGTLIGSLDIYALPPEWMRQDLGDNIGSPTAPAGSTEDDEDRIHDPDFTSNRAWTSSNVDKYHRRAEAAAVAIQKHFRGNQARKAGAALVNATPTLEKDDQDYDPVNAGPACAVEKEGKTSLTGSRLAQALSQNRQWAQTSFHVYHERTEAAVIVLQKHFRGAIARAEAARRRQDKILQMNSVIQETHSRAALNIQRVFRGHLARRRYVILLKNRHWAQERLVAAHVKTEHAVDLLKTAFHSRKASA